jgi:tRNA(Ile)-lysidine synthase
LNSNSEHSAEKITAILREENEALDAIVSDFLHKSASVGKIRREDFLSLHRGILNRAIIKFVNINTGANLEFVHTQKIKELLYKGSEFRTDIPTGFSFVCDGEYCYTAKKADVESVGEPEYVTERKLILGLNEIEQMGIAISLSKNDNIDFSSNVYKFSIQAKVNFDIIEGNLTVRSKIDGDSYTFGGMRRRLKRLFTDKKIPKDERRRIPVICDDNGILWVPGFSVRDGARAASGQNIIYITVYSKSNTDKESDAQPGV